MKLKVKKRKSVRKKAKTLLIKGVLSGVIYGPRRDVLPIKVDVSEFEKVFDKAGYSQLIDMEIEGEKKTVKALVREVQYDPVTDEKIHFSLFELDLSKPITAEVPVLTRGKSKAVEEKVGFLVTPFEMLEVRCLPDKLPSKLIVDISDLNEIGDSISVKDLSLSEGVELTESITDSATLAYIAPPQKEIVEEEEKVEVPVGEEAEEGEEVEAEVAEGEEGEEAGEKEGEEVEKGTEDKEVAEGEKVRRKSKKEFPS